MVLQTLVAALVLGMGAQMLAERLRIPAILPLLLFGIGAGPYGLGWFDPHSLGEVFEVFVHLGVAIILFEGGLSLDLQRLARVGRTVRNLLTIGVVVTGVGAAWLAHGAAGVPWEVAALFGAIVTVTGPTVIVPLLRQMIAPSEVKTVLVSEGLIVDPIGAVLAYLVLQWIQHTGIPLAELSTEVATLLAVGALVGFGFGSAASRLLLRGRKVSAGLRNPAILAAVLACYLFAESFAAQSGILAVVVMGLTISGDDLPDLLELRSFKEELTVLLISMLFVLLAGNLDPLPVLALGWRGALVVGGLIVLVRPLSVFLSVWPGSLTGRERVLLALTAPRGIVAAAVASLVAAELTAGGIDGGSVLEGLVYLTILATGVFSTLGAIVLPKVLGWVDDPSRRRTVLVGAHPIAGILARELANRGRNVVVADIVPWRLESFREDGFTTVCGDARDAATYEEAGVERDTTLVAMTTNDALNLLVAETVRSEFGVEHPVVCLKEPPDELGRRSRAWIDLLGGRAVNLQAWISDYADGKVEVITLGPEEEDRWQRLRELEKTRPDDVLRLVGWAGDEPIFKLLEAGADDLESITVLVERSALDSQAFEEGRGE